MHFNVCDSIRITRKSVNAHSAVNRNQMCATIDIDVDQTQWHILSYDDSGDKCIKGWEFSFALTS